MVEEHVAVRGALPGFCQTRRQTGTGRRAGLGRGEHNHGERLSPRTITRLAPRPSRRDNPVGESEAKHRATADNFMRPSLKTPPKADSTFQSRNGYREEKNGGFKKLEDAREVGAPAVPRRRLVTPLCVLRGEFVWLRSPVVR